MIDTDPAPLSASASPRRESGLGLMIILGLMLLSLVMVVGMGWWLFTTKWPTESSANSRSHTNSNPNTNFNSPDQAAKIIASATRLSLAADPQHAPLNVVRIAGAGALPQELRWEVTLLQVPTGKPLALRGEWIDPRSRVVHRHSYRTKTVTHNPWTTHIRYQLPGDSAVGAWRVRLFVGQKTIAEQVFRVERP